MKIWNKNIVSILAVISCALFTFKAIDFENQRVFDKFHPANYVEASKSHSHYQDDWGMQVLPLYDRSLTMRSYKLLDSIGITPIQTDYIFGFLVTLLLAFSIYRLSFLITKSELAAYTSVILGLLSKVSNLNLARYGHGLEGYARFISPYSYGWAHGLGILGLSYAYQRNFPVAFLTIFLSFLCHPSIAFFYSCFCAFSFVFSGEVKQRSNIISFLLFLFSVLIVYTTVLSPAGLQVQMVPDEIWLNQVRLLNYHWFPSALSLFTSEAYDIFMPLLAGFIFSLLIVYTEPPKRWKRLFLISGLFTVLGISIFGYIFIEIVPIKSVILLSPMRSQTIVSLVFIILIGKIISQQVDSPTLFSTPLALTTFILMTTTRPGFPFILIGLLVLITSSSRITKVYSGIVIGLSVASIIFVKHLSGIWEPLAEFDTERLNLGIMGGAWKPIGFEQRWIWVFMLVIVLALSFSYLVRLKKASYMALLALVLFSYPLSQPYLKNSEHIAKARDFASIQNWSKKETPADSMFLIDPVANYSWRFQTKRKNFGNFWGWLHDSFCYLPTSKLHTEGSRRALLFGFDLKDYPPKFAYEKSHLSIIEMDFADKYLNLSQEQVWHLVEDEGIDYFIVDNSRIPEVIKSLDLVFSNYYFSVYKSNN